MDKQPTKDKTKAPHKNFAILTRTYPILSNGKWIHETEKFEVQVMAVADNYAMVRRPRCMPFVCNINNLEIKPRNQS